MVAVVTLEECLWPIQGRASTCQAGIEELETTVHPFVVRSVFGSLHRESSEIENLMRKGQAAGQCGPQRMVGGFQLNFSGV